MMTEQILTTEQEALLTNAVLLPVPLPPQFVSLINYTGGNRFLMIFYMGTQATVADGRVSRGFSYYQAYEPLVSHPAVWHHLARRNADLGSDDTETTHALVLDTIENKMYLADYGLARAIIGTQTPTTDDGWRKVAAEGREIINKLNRAATIADFQAMGMFEIFGGTARAATSRDVQAMKLFLDEYLSPELKTALGRYTTYIDEKEN
jgi:hypothetical protein